MRTMKLIAPQAKADLRKRGFKPVWYFKSPAVQYGIAVRDGEVWVFTICCAKASLHGRVVKGKVGMLGHYSPTKELAAGLKKAKAKLNIV